MTSTWPTLSLLAILSIPVLAREVPVVSTVSGISPVGSGTVNLSETRDANGKVLKVAQIFKNNDTIQVGARGTITRIWWFCTQAFDTTSIPALNPGTNGEAPRIDLNMVKGINTLVNGIIPVDTTVDDTSSLREEIRHYQLDWRKPNILTLVSVTLLDSNGHPIGAVPPSPPASVSTRTLSAAIVAKNWQLNTGSLELHLPGASNLLGRSR